MSKKVRTKTDFRVGWEVKGTGPYNALIDISRSLERLIECSEALSSAKPDSEDEAVEVMKFQGFLEKLRGSLDFVSERCRSGDYPRSKPGRIPRKRYLT